MAGLQPLLHDLAITLAAPTVVLSGQDGQIRSRGAHGVLSGDLRVLNQAVVTVDGHEPEPISHTDRAGGHGEFIAIIRTGVGSGADPVTWLRRQRVATGSGLAEDLELVSVAATDQRFDVQLELRADFASIEAIKAGARVDEVDPAVRDGVVTWQCGKVRVRVEADGAEVDVGTAVRLRWSVVLPAFSTARLRWSLHVEDGAAIAAPGRSLRLPEVAVSADDPRLARLVQQSVRDLSGLLMSEIGQDQDVFLGAGAPWYLTMFGRDSIWAARMLLPLSVELAAGTLRTLARAQGRVHDPSTGEAPGKIPHERRRMPFEPTGPRLPPLYYGTVDATALWVCLLHDAWRWGLAEDEIGSLLPALRAALGFVVDQADDDAFARYFDESGTGLANQGWKDSSDAIRFADGTIATGPVALVEVQGYRYEALRKGADVLAALGEPDACLLDHAERLAAAFRDRFWPPAGNGAFPALALDGAGKPVDSPASNIGHLLGTGILDATESDQVGARLMRPDLAGGYGLRTLSRDTAGYSPLSYHCGSVWPHDTAIAIRGLAGTGQQARAAGLAAQLLRAAEHFAWRLPELFAGFGPDETGRPVPYPASCRPQAWSAAAAITLVQTLLGLAVDVPRRVITVRPPRPGPLGAIRVEGLPLAGATLAVSVDRDGTVLDVGAPPGFRVDT
ncbi:MAG: hypothetical protein L0H84_02660 [Pseudonocardia sp.]|nr:hypothetical protein [Pseudonocardia sp.]